MSGSTTHFKTTTANTATNHAGLVLLLQANCQQLINPQLFTLQEKHLELISDILCLLVNLFGPIRSELDKYCVS